MSETRPPATTPAVLEQLRRRFIYGLAFGLAVVLAIILLTDGQQLWRTLRDFDWRLLPAVFLLTLLNYGLRFVKWQLYLRWLDIGPLRTQTSLGIFASGLSMVVTPGKIGEFLKSYLLRRAAGTPMARSAPIIVLERLTDGLALLLLAAVGLTTVRYGWPLLLALGLACLAGILMLQRRSLIARILTALGRFPVVSGRVHVLETFYQSTWLLLRPKRLLLTVGLGIISWSGEGIAFFLILVGLGLPMTAELAIIALFILATATIVGSLSMLPGGLGAAEAGVAGLLLILADDPLVTSELAGAATLMIRFATLWFGVLIGLGALFWIERHLNSLEQPQRSGLEPVVQTRSDTFSSGTSSD